MFRRVRNFISRHPKKVTAVAVIAVGTIAWKLAKRRFSQWQDEQSRKLFENARRQQHFEATLQTANDAMIALGPRIAEAVTNALDTTAIMNKLSELKDKKGDEWRKVWAQLKEMVICRVIALVYSQVLLCVLLRIQVAVLAGKLYKNSSDEVQGALLERELTTCQKLITNGIPKLCSHVAATVSRCPSITDIYLGQKLTLQDLEKMLWSVQTLLCEDSNLDPLRTIDRLTEAEDVEVQEILNSNEVWSLASSCVSRGLAYTVDNVATFYDTSSVETPQDFKPSSLTLPLPRIIAVMDSIMRKSTNPSEASVDYLRVLINEEKLKILSANIYEAFGDTDCNHNPSASSASRTRN